MDGVPGELCHCIPETMAQIVYPLFLKETAYQREALIFKGGRLAPAHKKGDPSQCNNHGSLFVSSMLGKVLHSLYRQKLGPVLEEVRLPMQIGGVKGHSIVQASHSLVLFQSWCRRRGYSMAIIFVDIANAFYRLIRHHIVTVGDDQRSLDALFHQLGLPQEASEEFQSHPVQQPALEVFDLISSNHFLENFLWRLGFKCQGRIR